MPFYQNNSTSLKGDIYTIFNFSKSINMVSLLVLSNFFFLPYEVSAQKLTSEVILSSK